MNYFYNCNNIEELKKMYRKLALQFHPDRPSGDLIKMQTINLQYEKMYKILKEQDKKDNGRQDNFYANEEQIKEFFKIISELINYENIEIEIIGTWLWVSGDTKQIKERLKVLGFKWSKQKCTWYWHEGNYKVFGKKSHSMDHIREKYGSKKVKKENKKNRAQLQNAN